MSNFSCPHCGSGNIQKCSVIYNQGTSHSHSRTTVGDIEGETEGHSSTGLANTVAPPQEKETSWGAAIFLGILAFGFIGDSFIIGGVLGLLSFGCFSSTFEARKYNSDVYPKELKRWQNSYFCHRCGNVFTL